MDAQPCSSFFLQPREPLHRQYEALRAVLVDEEPMREVAVRFGYRYDTVRAMVGRFRRQFDDEQQPPFSPRRAAVDHPAASRRTKRKSRRPTPAV